jgi:hypothetical protein
VNNDRERAIDRILPANLSPVTNSPYGAADVLAREGAENQNGLFPLALSFALV